MGGGQCKKGKASKAHKTNNISTHLVNVRTGLEEGCLHGRTSSVVSGGAGEIRAVVV